MSIVVWKRFFLDLSDWWFSKRIGNIDMDPSTKQAKEIYYITW